MSDILDDRIAEARRHAARGDATDAEWLMLIQARQCGVLQDIQRTSSETLTIVRTFALDRKRALAVIAAVLGSGAVGGGIVSAIVAGVLGGG